MTEYRNTDMLTAISEYVHNAKYREILRMRFCEGMTHEEIASLVSYSPQHIRSICKTYKEILMRVL